MSLAISSDDVDAVVFDFGGVILPLDFDATIGALSELLDSDASVHFTRLEQATLFDDFETGRIEAATFRERLWKLAARDPQNELWRTRFDDGFEHAWNALLGPIPEENVSVLEKLSQKTRLFLLSNTNDVHLRRALADYGKAHPTRRPFESHFERVHYSHLMGLRKPDPAIYRQVLRENGLTAERTLFVDDNEINIAAARSVGINAVHHPKNSPLAERFARFFD